VPLVAKVSCRAESRGEERPVAVTVGGRRIGVVDILERAFVGAADAGEPVRARITVELEDGSVVQLERSPPAGGWRVWRIDTV
jgi:phage tail protein X